MKRALELLGIGCLLCAISVQVNGGDLPSAVENGSSLVSTSPVSASARGLEGLSPGNRLIAQALHAAQTSTTLTGHQPWSLERISLARASGRHWGEVFQQLKRNGLVEAETLGQVVS